MYITRHKTVESYFTLNTMMSPQFANDSEVYRQDIEKIKKYLTDNGDITALISSEFSVSQMIITAKQARSSGGLFG